MSTRTFHFLWWWVVFVALVFTFWVYATTVGWTGAEWEKRQRAVLIPTDGGYAYPQGPVSGGEMRTSHCFLDVDAAHVQCGWDADGGGWQHVTVTLPVDYP